MTARRGCRAQNGTAPDVLVAGTALWHALHVHDAGAYEGALARLGSAAGSLLPATSASFLSSSQVRVQGTVVSLA